jgi:hypothetical protein
MITRAELLGSPADDETAPAWIRTYKAFLPTAPHWSVLSLL